LAFSDDGRHYDRPIAENHSWTQTTGPTCSLPGFGLLLRIAKLRRKASMQISGQSRQSEIVARESDAVLESSSDTKGMTQTDRSRALMSARQEN
jgi:hypothetical protein